MPRILPVLAALAVCLPVCLAVFAQPITLNAPRPISVTRSAAVTRYVTETKVASNGRSYLVSWVDDRYRLSSVSQFPLASQLMRTDSLLMWTAPKESDSTGRWQVRAMRPFAGAHRLMIATVPAQRERATHH